MIGSNPFNKWKLGYKPLWAAPSNPGGNMTPANSKVNSSQGITTKAAGSLRSSENAIDVNLPRNFFVPPSGQSLVLTEETTIADGILNFELLEYIVQEDSMVQLTQFSLATSAEGNVDFIPTVNGHRVWPNIGRPSDNYRLRFSTPLELAQLPLKPHDVFRWLISNESGADATMSVKTVGFIITNQPFEDTRFGG